MTEKQSKYREKLKRMVCFETISVDGANDVEKFRKFHVLLRELFPNVFKACVIEDFDGSLLLKLAGKGNGLKPVLFLNHQDVVEATGKWQHEPFAGAIDDERLWGRGTLDDKGGLFAMLQAAEELINEGFVPETDIYFLTSCTEETDGSGADRITAELKKRGIQFEMSFDEGGMVMYDPIGGADGTFAIVGVGEKGCADIKFIARSKGGHASTPGRNTPLVRLGKFMASVERKDLFKSEISPTVIEMLKRLSPYMGVTGFFLKNPKLLSPLLKRLLPKMSDTAGALLKTTLAFTMAKGSDGVNVLPQEAWVMGNMRFSHHQDLDASLKVLSKLATKYDIEIEVLDPGFSSKITDFGGKAFGLVTDAVRKTLPYVDEIIPYVMTGASDSRYCDRICKESVRFLPFLIDDEQLASIHGIDENIKLDVLVPAVEYYRYLFTNVGR